MTHRTDYRSGWRRLPAVYPVLAEAQAGVLAHGVSRWRRPGCAAPDPGRSSWPWRCAAPTAARGNACANGTSYRAEDKCGLNRRSWTCGLCFAAADEWVLAHWSGTQLPWPWDATSLGEPLTILAVSIVYKGTAIPIAWKILPRTASTPGNRSGWPCWTWWPGRAR